MRLRWRLSRIMVIAAQRLFPSLATVHLCTAISRNSRSCPDHEPSYIPRHARKDIPAPSQPLDDHSLPGHDAMKRPKCSVTQLLAYQHKVADCDKPAAPTPPPNESSSSDPRPWDPVIFPEYQKKTRSRQCSARQHSAGSRAADAHMRCPYLHARAPSHVPKQCDRCARCESYSQ